MIKLSPNLRRFVVTSTTFIGGNVVANAIALVGVCLLSRNLPLEIFGLLTVIQSTVALIESLVNQQSWQGFVRFGHLHRTDPERMTVLARSAQRADLLGGFLSSIIGIPCLLFFYSDSASIAALAAYCLSCSFRIAGLTTGLLRVEENFAALYQRAAVVSLTRLSGIVLLLFTDKLYLEEILWLYSASEVFGTLFHLSVSRAYKALLFAEFSSTEHLTLARDFRRYNQTLWLGSVFTTVVKQIDILMIGALLSTSDAGIYRVLKQVGSIAGLLTQPISVLVFPELSKRVARDGRDETIAKTDRIGVKLALLSLVIYVASLPFLGFALRLFGAPFEDGRSALAIYLLSVVLTFAFSYLHPLLLALGEVRAIAIFNVINSILYIIYAWILISLWGVVGAATAQLLFMTLSILPRWTFMKTKTNSVPAEAQI